MLSKTKSGGWSSGMNGIHPEAEQIGIAGQDGAECVAVRYSLHSFGIDGRDVTIECMSLTIITAKRKGVDSDASTEPRVPSFSGN